VETIIAVPKVEASVAVETRASTIHWFRAATEERSRRTQQDLSGGEALDDDHAPAAFGQRQRN
jgi:hypothetical protein